MKYILRRVLALLLTLLFVSVLAFSAFNIIPGDAAQLILGTEATPARLEALRETLGLNYSLPEQYVRWISGLLSGNFGNSIKYNQPVGTLLSTRIPVTLSLAILSLLLIILISIPLGVYIAKKRNTAIERFLNFTTMLSISIPGFFLGILITWFCGIVLRIFTPGGYVSYSTDFGGFIRFIFFPALALAIPNIAVIVKFLRTSILEQLKRDYVKTAYSKGNLDNAVLYRHVLKNALVPVISLIGMVVAEVFSGSIIVEQVFNLPGVGSLLISAITSRDYPLIENMVIMISLIIVVVNSASDVALQLVDPRIKIN